MRRRLYRRWTPYAAGAFAGLIIALSISIWWHQSYAQPSVTLLGSGHGLSALITTSHTRLLIVGGDDPIAFANAFANARPATERRIDLLIITPGDAAERVAERALALSEPQRIMAIESSDASARYSNVVNPVRSVESVRTVTLENELDIVVDPGLTLGQPRNGWTIMINAPSSSVLLAERAPARVSASVGFVAIMADGDEALPAFSGVAIAMAEPNQPVPDGRLLGTVKPGESARLPLADEGVIVPAAWLEPTR